MRLIAVTGSTADGTVAGAGKDYVVGLLAARRIVVEGGAFHDLVPELRRSDPSYMTAQLLGPDAVAMSFADPIKEFGRALFGWSVETCWGSSSAREVPDPETGVVPRELFQKIGTEGGRATDPNLWLYALERRIARYLASLTVAPGGQVYTPRMSALVIGDLRFPSEADWVRERGGEVWFLDAESRGASISAKYATHESEAYGFALRERATRVIDNSGTREETRAAVVALIEDSRTR